MNVKISTVQDHTNIVEYSYFKEFKNKDELYKYLDDNSGHPWVHLDWEIIDE